MDAPTTPPPTDAARVPASGKPLPLIGRLPVEAQFQVLGIVFLVSLLVAIAGIYLQTQTATRATAYLSISGQIRPLAQQVPKAAAAALQGDEEGFKELRAARNRYAELLDRLSTGGAYEGLELPPTSDKSRPALDRLATLWQGQDRSISTLFAQEKSLIQLGKLAQESYALGNKMAAMAKVCWNVNPRCLNPSATLKLPKITAKLRMELSCPRRRPSCPSRASSMPMVEASGMKRCCPML